MKLTKEEKDILNGAQGQTKAKIMRTLVEFGDLFDKKIKICYYNL